MHGLGIDEQSSIVNSVLIAGNELFDTFSHVLCLHNNAIFF